MPSTKAQLAARPTCTFAGCTRRQRSLKQGLCQPHTRQVARGEELRPLRQPNGSTWRTAAGYVKLSAPGHPNAVGAAGQILAHRLVMANHLGRPLLPGETVHHKDGDRSNNAIENLELWGSYHGPGQRHADHLAYCVGFVREHAPHLLRL